MSRVYVLSQILHVHYFFLPLFLREGLHQSIFLVVNFLVFSVTEIYTFTRGFFQFFLLPLYFDLHSNLSPRKSLCYFLFHSCFFLLHDISSFSGPHVLILILWFWFSVFILSSILLLLYITVYLLLLTIFYTVLDIKYLLNLVNIYSC